MTEPAAPREEPAALDLAAEVEGFVRALNVTHSHFDTSAVSRMVDAWERCRAERDALQIALRLSTDFVKSLGEVTP